MVDLEDPFDSNLTSRDHILEKN